MDVALIDATVAEALLYRTHGISEVVHVELLEARTGQRARIVDALKKRINLDCRLSGRGQRALGALALSPQAADGALISRQVLAPVLSLKVL
mmetsp:Transcript_42979/g.124247  ORF Transcript_42979/g.124247 Transcript_42979/m.124247 type:complete len:92 (+) Transcript_42979:1076-1351(+)